MMDIVLPPNLKSFLRYMENVHSFGAIIPNPLSYLKKYATNMTNERFYNRGFVTNYSLYLCGSDIEMILLQLIAGILISKLSTK
jgi:hypothetical protein